MSDSQRWPFRKESGDVVWVRFEQMMEADAAGFLELGGETLRRARDLEPRPEKRAGRVKGRAVPLSDALGFTRTVLPEMADHLKQSGCRGIEFKEDPDVPGFYQVQADSEAAKMRYARSRGFTDQNSRNGSGAILGATDLRSARELVLRER